MLLVHGVLPRCVNLVTPITMFSRWSFVPRRPLISLPWVLLALGVSAYGSAGCGILGGDGDSSGQAATSVDDGRADCAVGTETCACYPNSTCNSGLQCLSDLCVDVPSSSHSDRDEQDDDDRSTDDQPDGDDDRSTDEDPDDDSESDDGDDDGSADDDSSPDDSSDDERNDSDADDTQADDSSNDDASSDDSSADDSATDDSSADDTRVDDSTKDDTSSDDDDSADDADVDEDATDDTSLLDDDGASDECDSFEVSGSLVFEGVQDRETKTWLVQDHMEVTFDSAYVLLRHKRDVDQVEDGCIREIFLYLESGSGCMFELTAEGCLDAANGIRVSDVSFMADSQCPDFLDIAEGQYGRGAYLEGLVEMSQLTIDDYNVESSCVAQRLELSLGGSLEDYGGDRLLIPNPTGRLVIEGTFNSAAGDGPCPLACSARPACSDVCPYALDGQCDHPGTGTGLCSDGTDCTDCEPGPGCDSCLYANDGICNEGGLYPLCEDGTDCDDCDPANSLCGNSCVYPSDGICDDGGPGAETALCSLGTDCDDCGVR